MSAITLNGQIKKIFDERRISERFNTREFVLLTESDSPYPQSILLTLVNQNCDLIIGKHPGDKVQCNINIKGREHSGPNGTRYYNTIECWRIYKDEAE
jgi:hypothetical protein